MSDAHQRPTALDQAGDGPALVITPGGLRLSNQIVQIDDGEVVRPPRRRRKPQDPNKGTWLDGAVRASWIVAAVRQGGPVQDFTADIVVPAEPSRAGSQLIYIFAGLQDEPTTMILQPVLQWGAPDDPAGWHLRSWLVDRQTGKAHSTKSVSVATGAHVRARMRRTGKDGARHAYTCDFEGYGPTEMKIAVTNALSTAVAVLEAYGIKGSLDYPPDPAIRFDKVRVQQQQPGAWFPQNFVIDGGQHARIVNGAEPSVFELHCR